jgi:hypothetical protein
VTITILGIIHWPAFYLEQRLKDWILSPDTSNNTNRVYKATTTQTTNEELTFSIP